MEKRRAGRGKSVETYDYDLFCSLMLEVELQESDFYYIEQSIPGLVSKSTFDRSKPKGKETKIAVATNGVLDKYFDILDAKAKKLNHKLRIKKYQELRPHAAAISDSRPAGAQDACGTRKGPNANYGDELLARIRKAGKLRVACLPECPIGRIVERDGKYYGAGIFPDIISDVCSRNKLDVEFVQINCSQIIASVQQGDVDVAIPIFSTQSRRSTCDFCGLAMSLGVSALTSREGFLGTVAECDLIESKAAVATCDGEVGHEILRDHLGIKPGRMLYSNTATVANALNHLGRGAEFGLASSLTCIDYLIEERKMGRHAALDIVRRNLLYVCAVGFAIRHGQYDFRNWIDEQVSISMRTPKLSQQMNDVLSNNKGVAWRCF